jgi:hypothetical protein
MRRLDRSMTVAAFLIALASACGSTSTDGRPGVVLQFENWDNTGIEQQDSVTGGSASVDVAQSICSTDFLFTNLTFETFTQTIVNAVFLNESSTDILLQQYRIHFDDPSYAIGDMVFQIGAVISGGRCSNAMTRSCAVDTDCVIPGQMSSGATCDHPSTLVSGILLFDFLTKERIATQKRLLGRATSITVTFTGASAISSYSTTASYVVTFDDFCNCPSGSFCVPAEALPGGR